MVGVIRNTGGTMSLLNYGKMLRKINLYFYSAKAVTEKRTFVDKDTRKVENSFIEG